MRTAAVVAWREIVEYRVFLAAAVAASLVSLVAPFIPGVFGWSPAEVRGVLTAVMAIGFTTVCAVTLGASTVSGTVGNGRFGFFMARPLSGVAIWFGKLLGVLALIATCELIVILPAAVSADGPAFFLHVARHPWVWSAVLIGAPLLLILLAHFAGTIWRARTVWLALDGGVLIVVFTAGWMVVQPLLAAGAQGSVFDIVLALVGSFAVAVLVAGAVQVTGGGVDLRRHHRLHSVAVWAVSLSLTAAVVGYGRWLATPGFDELLWVSELSCSDPDGQWISISGQARDRRDIVADFAYNAGTGDSVRIGIGSSWGRWLEFSRDRRRVAWSVHDRGGWRIRYASLEGFLRGDIEGAVILNRKPRFVLSRTGELLASIEDDLLVVTALPRGEVVFSTRLASVDFVIGPDFASNDRLMVVTFEPSRELGRRGRSVIVGYDVGTGTPSTVRALPEGWIASSVEVDDDRDRILLKARKDDEEGYWYIDGATFEDVPWSAERDLGEMVSLMADGRLARVAGEPGAWRFEVLMPDGTMEGGLDLSPTVEWFLIGSQPFQNAIVLAVNDGAYEGEWMSHWRLKLVDLESWETEVIGTGLIPQMLWQDRDFDRPVPVGSPATHVFIGERSSLHLWDPTTGGIQELLPGWDPVEN